MPDDDQGVRQKERKDIIKATVENRIGGTGTERRRRYSASVVHVETGAHLDHSQSQRIWAMWAPCSKHAHFLAKSRRTGNNQRVGRQGGGGASVGG